jgi:hypothetical protein
MHLRTFETVVVNTVKILFGSSTWFVCHSQRRVHLRGCAKKLLYIFIEQKSAAALAGGKVGVYLG